MGGSLLCPARPIGAATIRNVKAQALVRSWPAAAIVLLAWPAIHWLFWPGYLSTYDGIYHLTRMIEVDSLVRQGVLYPRWFPDFGQGHGYPIFNFFPPFGYLLTELPALIVRDLPLAIQLSMAASMVVSGWGMYLLARELGSRPAAAVAAAAFYLYFPYHVQDVYTRGGMPELWAMAWLPWLAWAQVRAAWQPGAVRIGLAGLLGALEVGTHNILAVFMLPLSLALSLLFAPPKRQAWLAAAACSGLALLLSTGYWLPAVAEARLTHVQQLAGDWLRYHAFDLPKLVDPVFFAPYGDQVYKLTALEAGFIAGLLVLLAWRATRSPRRLPLLGLLGLTLLVVFGLTSWSVWLWTHIPLMGYIQFPWRLLILLGFVASAMAAAAGGWHRFSWIPLGAVAAALAVGSLGQVPTGRFATTPPLDARSLQTQEFGSALDGVAIESEYQPATSSQDLMKASQGKRLPEDGSAFPPLAIQSLATRPTSQHLALTAEQATTLRLQSLYFPGWRARLDGQAWPIRSATPAGLVEADVPAGAHTLDLAYTGTALEGIAGLISGLTLLGIVAWLLRRRPLALGALLAATAVGAVLLGRSAAGLREPRPVSWAPAAGQTLVAASAPRGTARGIEVDLFWLFSAPHESAFDFVLRDASGHEVQRTPAASAATLPYEYVTANELLERRYTLTGVPDGQLSVSLESPAAAPMPLGPVAAASSPPAHTLDVAFQDRAVLAGYWADSIQPRPGLAPEHRAGRADATLNPGGFLRVSLLWRSLRAMDRNYVTFVHLLDAGGRAWASHDNQPNATLQATSSWVPGQTIPDAALLRVPEEAPPGIYRLEVGLYQIDELGYHFLPLASGGNSVLFGSIKVRPRSPAPLAASPMAAWTDGIQLAGWRQARQDAGLALTFDWQASAPPSRDYTLFVHLTDAGGNVAAQADSPPQAGAFPTSLWEAGDALADAHVLQKVPAGAYRLSIGWYRPDTGQRLPLASGGDELDLGEVAVPG
jgi:hypothetical protein